MSEKIKIEELTLMELNELHKKTLEGHQLSYRGLEIQPAWGGVAVFDGSNTIILNKNLLQYPELLLSVLDHEVEHFEDTKKEKNTKDSIVFAIKTELRDIFKENKQTLLFGFQVKHPEAMLPVLFYQKDKKNYRIIILNQLLLIGGISIIVFAALLLILNTG